MLMLQYECVKVGAGYYMHDYQTTGCFSGTTLFMAAASGVALIIYVPLTMIAVLMCKETQGGYGNGAAGKYAIKRDVVRVLLKVALPVAFLFRDTVFWWDNLHAVVEGLHKRNTRRILGRPRGHQHDTANLHQPLHGTCITS